MKCRSRSTGKAKSATHGLQLGQAHIAQLRKALPQVAQPEGMVVVVRVDLGEQPGRARIRA
jgi:hypothetical protein